MMWRENWEVPMDELLKPRISRKSAMPAVKFTASGSTGKGHN